MKISLRDKLIYPWNMKIQNFLMWFKNGLGASALSGRMGKTGVFKIWVKRASLNYG